MKLFADNVRGRAHALGLANAEVARRAGIGERTFANYVLDRTEPSLDALVRISRALQCTVDELLTASEPPALSERERTIQEVRSSVEALSDDDLAAISVQIQAVLKMRGRPRST